MASLRSTAYSISIGNNALKDLYRFLTKISHSSCFILCDENTLQHCLPVLIAACPRLASAEVLELESGENSKLLEISTMLWQTLMEKGADKQTLLIHLGGGVISDLGGFTASVYKRGIDFINIPTSLLAMADASVGAKTGIDFNGIKNSIGTFAEPKAVFIYPPFISTLPQRHIKNGLAEIFKMALIADLKFWKSLRSDLQNAEIEALVFKSVELKNKIVLKDPFDKGIRRILNFGHTIGHAIEAALLGHPNELLHGEAIVIGMIVESHIACQKKLITKKELTEITETLLSVFKPTDISMIDPADLMALAANDKKNTGKQIRFSLLKGIGKCGINIPATPSQIQKALAYYSTVLK